MQLAAALQSPAVQQADDARSTSRYSNKRARTVEQIHRINDIESETAVTKMAYFAPKCPFGKHIHNKNTCGTDNDNSDGETASKRNRRKRHTETTQESGRRTGTRLRST